MLENPKIVFLGTGDALNNCGKAHQSILIEYASRILLVDCGPTTLYMLQNRYRDSLLPELDGVLFTHLHGDHFLGTLFLDLALDRVWKRTNDIIYAGVKGLEQHFLQNYHLSYPTLYPNPNSKFRRIFQEYQENKSYDIFNDQSFFITPIRMKHGNVICYGYRIQMGKKIIAISGDTEWNENIPILCKNTRLSILECKFNQKRVVCDHHLSWEEIAQNIGFLQTQKIALIHVGSEMPQLSPSFDAFVCKDGDEVVLEW